MSNAAALTAEIIAALDEVGQLEKWIEQRMTSNVESEPVIEAVGDVSQQLLEVDPPQTAYWEHLLVAIATHSAKSNSQIGFKANQAAIAKLIQMIPEESFQSRVTPNQIVTLASSLTVALTAQRKLRQRIEEATGLLCETSPELLPSIAQRCQDIRQRHGQTSGSEGLFVWDTRRGEWRLRQDFRPYRPSA